MTDAQQDITARIERLRENYETRKTHSYEWRIQQLKRLEALMLENTEEFIQALQEELGHDYVYAKSQIVSVIDQTMYFRKNTHKLMKSERLSPSSFSSIPCKAMHTVEPKGLVLIISPWNYPVPLVGRYLAGSIAAGNATVIKPSEIAPKVSAVWARLISKYLDPDFIICVEGGIPETTLLLEQRFDHIMYTGSTQVGKIIMTAAAKHLATVTLELGGKNPCFVDEAIFADKKRLEVLVDRMIFGKLTNCGQVCLCIDYILVEESLAPVLIKQLVQRIQQLFGSTAEEIQKAKKYHRIINERHVQRIKSYIDEVPDYIVHGGTVDQKDRFIEPTIIRDPPMDSKVMNEEVFGPVLVIKTVKNVDEAIKIVNGKPYPLTLYIFSDDKKRVNYIRERTRSGCVTVNDTIVHVGESELRFGGVGNSGMGGVNGKWTFFELSQIRPVFETIGTKMSLNELPDGTEKYLEYLVRDNFVTKVLFPVILFFVNLYTRIFH